MELSPTVKINFLFNHEKYHGTKVLEESIGQSWARDAKAQVGDFEERPIWQEGQEPETGDRDRTLRSSPRGKESPSEKKFKEKLEQTKEQQKEIRTQVETLTPESCSLARPFLPAIHIFPAGDIVRCGCPGPLKAATISVAKVQRRDRKVSRGFITVAQLALRCRGFARCALLVRWLPRRAGE